LPTTKVRSILLSGFVAYTVQRMVRSAHKEELPIRDAFTMQGVIVPHPAVDVGA
jgi:hypothetical protein